MRSLSELAATERQTRAVDFYELGRALLRSQSNMASDVLRRAKASSNTPPRVLAALEKAASGAGTVANLGDLSEVSILSAGFVNSLIGVSVFDTVMQSAVRVPWYGQGIRILSAVQTYPGREGVARAVSRLVITPDSMSRHQSVSIIVLTDEVAESADAGVSAMISRELRAAVVRDVDVTFLTGMIAAALPTAAATGQAAGAFLDDLTGVMEAMVLDGSSRLVLVIPPVLAARLAMADHRGVSQGFSPTTGGTVGGIPTVVSTQIPRAGSPGSPIALLLDASAIAISDQGVLLARSDETSLQMDTDPTMASAESGSPQTPIHTTSVSMWQTNSRALKAQRTFAFSAPLRPGAVAALEVAAA